VLRPGKEGGVQGAPPQRYRACLLNEPAPRDWHRGRAEGREGWRVSGPPVLLLLVVVWW
jgi:hypothetical protein